jgi:hypothetical protein
VREQTDGTSKIYLHRQQRKLHHPAKYATKPKIPENPLVKELLMSKPPLELLHTDLCGPFEIPTIGGAKYMLPITDD